jgi:alcohol dehydrogenase class IV
MKLKLLLCLLKIGIPAIVYKPRDPLPTEENISDGVHLAERAGITSIVAVGTDTAIDIAKGIKLCLDSRQRHVKYFIPNFDKSKCNFPLFAFPFQLSIASLDDSFLVLHKKSNIVNRYMCPNFHPDLKVRLHRKVIMIIAA